MKRFYQILLTIFFATLILTVTAQTNCCNSGFTQHELPQTIGSKWYVFEMDDSSAADIVSVQWSFGDGYYSNDKTPAHFYAYTGNYSVTLTVYKQLVNGIQKSCSETHVLSVGNICSGFSYATSGLTVSFTKLAGYYAHADSSSGTAEHVRWSFGDGQISNDLNPTHTYLSAGTYTACLYQQYANDSIPADSCVVCHTIRVQDTADANVCRAGFTYELTDSLVFLHGYTATGVSAWSFGSDTNVYVYGQHAVLFIPAEGPVTVCHRQYLDSIITPQSVYCTECTLVRAVPVDSSSQCNADFTYTLSDSLLTLQPADSTGYASWWYRVNDIHAGSFTGGGSPAIYVPEYGTIDVCHLQYNAASDSCVVCKLVRGQHDTTACYSGFQYTVTGNTVSAYVDSVSSGKHVWKFENDTIGKDTLFINYAFSSPGIKRLCHTTYTDYNTYTDTCTTCRDILIEAAEVMIHPNPAVHHVNVKVKDGLLASITVYDIHGILVKSINGLNTNKYVVDVSDVPTGIYYVSTLLLDGRINRSKIIIQ